MFIQKNTAGERLIEDGCDIECVSACPTGWQKFDRKCYLWVTDEKRNWTAAENFCQSKESHLASVTSKEIDKFMVSTKAGDTGELHLASAVEGHP